MREVLRGGDGRGDHEQAPTVNPPENLGAPRRKTPLTAKKNLGAPLVLACDVRTYERLFTVDDVTGPRGPGNDRTY